ncbi:MAG TPA: hypothetical protein VJQ53_09455, partial [Candidatus Eisenbacteria bacterium]|nr:hypothetical protein [Candidatus Eisenbacteria bacterium]
QAMAAEGASLDQLVGMGLRKALEFLVKDFAISSAAARTRRRGSRRIRSAGASRTTSRTRR